jgi:hypothetical protein
VAERKKKARKSFFLSSFSIIQILEDCSRREEKWANPQIIVERVLYEKKRKKISIDVYTFSTNKSIILERKENLRKRET